MSDFEFSPFTPLHHDALDDWGLTKGTRVWMASGSFEAAQSVDAGDHVFGITFELEDVSLGEDDRGRPRFGKAWRPKLSVREVLAVNTVRARAWQMTFGDVRAQYEARRLVAGGETHPGLFPLTHTKPFTDPDEDSYAHRDKQMVNCFTAEDNPRVGSETRDARRVDREWSEEAGETKFRPTEFSGMPRGELATIIPYEAYGGQTGLFNTRVRPYNRYAFTQIREIVPLQAETELIQLFVQPDTTEELGVSEGQSPRCNIIAQTPFAKEKRRSKIINDPNSNNLEGIQGHGAREDFENQWDEYAKTMGNAEVTGGTEEDYETESQGMFHQTRTDEETAESLKENYGIEGGFLNGGILVTTPLHPRLK